MHIRIKKLALTVVLVLLVFTTFTGCAESSKVTVTIKSDPVGAAIYLKNRGEEEVRFGETPNKIVLDKGKTYDLHLENDNCIIYKTQITPSFWKRRFAFNLIELPVIYEKDIKMENGIKNGFIYNDALILSSESMLYSVNSSDGKINWSVSKEEVEKFVKGKVSFYNVKSINNLLFLEISSSEEGTLYIILQPEDGKILGKFRCVLGMGFPITSKRIFGSQATLIEFDYPNAGIQWQKELKGEFLKFLMWKGDTMYFSGVDDETNAFKLVELNAGTGTVIKRTNFPNVKGFFVPLSFPTVLYTFVLDDLVFVVADIEKVIYCIDLNTKSVKWQRELNSGDGLRIVKEAQGYLYMESHGKTVVIDEENGKSDFQKGKIVLAEVEQFSKYYLMDLKTQKTVIRLKGVPYLIAYDNLRMYLQYSTNFSDTSRLVLIDLSPLEKYLNKNF
jgi:hypothetical protein